MRIVGLSIALALGLLACDGGEDKDTESPTDETPSDSEDPSDDTDDPSDDTDDPSDDTDDSDDPSDDTDDPTDDTDEPTDTDDDDVGDPTEGLEGSEDCEDYDGTELAGATRFYVGDFEIDSDDVVTGTEYALYFANATWVSVGGDDCQIAWKTTGTKESCSGCDYTLELSMSIDKSATTCDEELWKGDEDFDATYEVTVSGGSTTYAFTSGTTLGTGETNASGTQSTYVSDSQCTWF